MKKSTAKIRVMYADTDAMGIVYHTNYIKWFEIGRSEYLREIGVVYAQMEEQGINLPLSEAYCQYLFPAVYDQIILIETEIAYVRRASLKFNYTLLDEKREKTFVEGYTIHACTNRDRKIVRIPLHILEVLKANAPSEE
ncbi:acyl-CoA thioesterase [Syntrophus aciditrophicus]|uniref:Thioesterase n=1 Tax=Syntrophus aciditrophicus (strain SB) TaxID=56780 RepID=Q2LTT9_SYNAS|nr:thioesterase family protein [Syntrophus aciditrophicus]ABC77495.1 thioesterase [Syntrophus aciditrophicus SB]OPY17032.1 MAG: Acyl-CoA thioester hydrolase YbgC [Syntrophus sp. PtaB.Bin075]